MNRQEKDKLTAICDRLIEDTTRRFQGEFFTPTEWVDEAHRMIENEFGEDWKDKYVVYDPACGTGNLTRDYKFKELYCSTLNQSDLDIMEQMGYNPEATKFQFDFLNDDIFLEGVLPIDEIKFKLPEGLKKALEEKKQIIIFMNPPYGIATKYQDKLVNISKTKVKEVMKQFKLGFSGNQIFIQFLFNCLLLNKYSNVNVCLFSPPTFICSTSYDSFRKVFYKQFKFSRGFLFNSSNFNDVSSSWGVLFSIWKNGEEKRKTFNIDVKEKDKNLNIVTKESIPLYAINGNSAKYWARDKTAKDNLDFPQLSSPLNVKNTGRGKICKDFLGYFLGSYRISDIRHVNIFSGIFSIGSGYSVTELNFCKCIALFTAQKATQENWFTVQNEYFAPITEHPDYQQWNNDCLVYSLFNNNSNQSSMRDIEYKEKQRDIKNEWFWMSRNQIQELAEIHTINEIEQDIKDFGGQERFVYNKLQETPLSEDAKNVLNKAIELVKDSFEYRKLMIEEYPEYHLNTWDTGWYQIKKILKKYMKDELKEFRILYKEFEDRMEKGVYKFEFLRK